ncbi:amidase [Paraurantiacibacter namhicola]|uniref:Glutamyl-tRNA(Gln) amidotransferase subunit A n=1 Tax=Paraurantiacibacter namhicola TaxID=645517 RepID=A0A1C7DBA4_9SPHN|nr:amidase [Paraurantiacibacter namhicola]ANU08662.1 Glutamyl-tRNA(Gln) amidotransferase subunit A [Paraurantiacibacter namhicola]
MKHALLASLALPLAALAAPAAAQEAEVDSEPITLISTPATVESAIRIHTNYIERFDDAGPMLNAVIVYDQDAEAKASVTNYSGVLEGRTVLLKDNIETREWPTTAGSLALADNMTGRDAPLVANIRANGGIIFGKTNLSEWANFRSTRSTSGWSAVGGQTRNPFATDRNTCGSSSGSGAAVAASFAWGAVGTETDGSITCPASLNGIVGFKPTVGLVSRTYIVPISASQDTAGPMTRTVEDAALLLTAMAGRDPMDPATEQAASYAGDFHTGLAGASLQGVRIGVMRKQVGGNPQVAEVFDAALADMAARGAVLVDIEYEPDGAMYEAEYAVLLYEFREGLEDYLANSPADLPARDLSGLIAFNEANADTELRWFGQEIFIMAADATDEDAYKEARATSFRLAGPDGIDALMEEHGVAVLVAPTRGPAWPIDLVLGDNFDGSIGAGSLAAIAGYPHLTVPMGHVEGLPVGISFIGGKWDDLQILRIGHAYEQARTAELPSPMFRSWADQQPEFMEEGVAEAAAEAEAAMEEGTELDAEEATEAL